MTAGEFLPPHWAGRTDFTVLVTQFGLGHDLLALWEAWRADARRPVRLHVLALAPRAPTAAEVAQAHAGSPRASFASALLTVWPPSAPGLHVLALEGGCVRLTLAVGEAQALLPRLRLQADALLIAEDILVGIGGLADLNLGRIEIGDDDEAGLALSAPRSARLGLERAGRNGYRQAHKQQGEREPSGTGGEAGERVAIHALAPRRDDASAVAAHPATSNEAPA
jgi:hypothetical protein